MELSSASQTLHNYIHKFNDEAASIFDDTCKNNNKFLPFLIEDFDLISSNDLNTTLHLADSMGFNISDILALHSSPNIICFQSLYNDEYSSVGLVFDLGESVSISPFSTDFVECFTSSSLNTTLHRVSNYPSI